MAQIFLDRQHGRFPAPHLLDRSHLIAVLWFLDDFDLDAAGSAVQHKDVALVFVNSDSGEGPYSTFWVLCRNISDHLAGSTYFVVSPLL